MSALAASALLAFAGALAFGAFGGKLPAGSPQTAASTAPAPAGSSAVLDPRIAALAAQHAGRPIEAIVQFQGSVASGAAKAQVRHIGGRVIIQLPIIHGLAVRMSASQARTLAMSPDIHSVSLNTKITPSEWSGGWSSNGGSPGGLPQYSQLPSDQLKTTYDQTLGAPTLWRYGVTGTGIGVAVIDTGIAGQLQDFNSHDGGSRVVASAVTNSGASNALDTYGHGTAVAGVIAGNSGGNPAYSQTRGSYIGVAPGANLISIKVADDNGAATVLNVIYGLQFAVDHKAQYNIRVVNLSLDSTTPQSYATDPLDAAVESAWMHGISVVAAAGNRGTASDAVQYAPANDPYAITVGAVDENGTGSPADDTITDWSSRGTTQDGVQKPDVNAPGAHITSVLAPDSAFARACSACVVDNNYIMASGTSLAAPMISGLAADLLQVHPNWTPDQLKGALTGDFASSNSTTGEVSGVRAALTRSPAPANQGQTPNQLLGSDGGIDYSLSRWSLSRWSTAPDSLVAGFAKASYVCSCLTSDPSAVDPSLSRWSFSSWSTLPLADGN